MRGNYLIIYMCDGIATGLDQTIGRFLGRLTPQEYDYVSLNTAADVARLYALIINLAGAVIGFETILTMAARWIT